MKSYTYTIKPIGNLSLIQQDSKAYKEMILGYERFLNKYNQAMSEDEIDWQNLALLGGILCGYEMAFLNMNYNVQRETERDENTCQK